VTTINGVASSEVGKAIRLRFPRSHAYARRAIMAFDSKPTESLIPNDGDLIFDATTGGGGRSPAETVLPYIEQRADPDTIYRDAGVVTTADHADFTLGSPEENDGTSQGIIIDWRTSGPGDELTAGFCATGRTEDGHVGSEGDGGFIDINGFVIDWTPGDGSKGETVGVIAIISPAENNYGGHSVLEFSIENHPNNASHSNDVDVGHADLLSSGDAPAGAGCSEAICGTNSPTTSSAPVESRGYAAGHFALEIESNHGASHLSLYDLVV